MRPGVVVFMVMLVGLIVWPAAELAGWIAIGVAVALLPAAGFSEGTWRALRWTFAIPAAALVADVVIFTPFTLQPDLDPTIFTPIALYYLPAWALLVAAGIGARRAQRRHRASPTATYMESSRRSW